jgi:hypothetical protein
VLEALAKLDPRKAQVIVSAAHVRRRQGGLGAHRRRGRCAHVVEVRA